MSHADSPPASFAGRRVVVTGSSSGIGRAMALRFAAAGASVVVHGGHDAQRLQRAVDEISAHGTPAIGVLADVGTPSGCDELVERAWNYGPVDVWINNAGADVLTGAAAAWSFERKLAAVWQVDVCGTILLSRAVGRRMRAQGSGVIINIGWDQAEVGMAGDSGEMFATSKGAIMAFTRSLAKSLAPQVRVNAIAPGWIRTSWGDTASEYWNDRACREALLGRWGTPQDVAEAALWLASPAASFINGQVIAVNGGFAGHGPPAS